MQSLSRVTLSVVMNMESPWTVKPWHIQVSFRKCGWEVPEDMIVLPEQPIKGPNLDIEGAEFNVTVVVSTKFICVVPILPHFQFQFSPKEKQDVKCRLHHWSTNQSDRLPYVKEFWKIPTKSVFETVVNEE